MKFNLVASSTNLFDNEISLPSEIHSLTIFRYSMYSLQGEGQGASHPSLALRREEPSIKEEWMEKINDVR